MLIRAGCFYSQKREGAREELVGRAHETVCRPSTVWAGNGSVKPKQNWQYRLIEESEGGQQRRAWRAAVGSLLLGCAADAPFAVADSPASPQIVFKSILDTFLCASFRELGWVTVPCIAPQPGLCQQACPSTKHCIKVEQPSG